MAWNLALSTDGTSRVKLDVVYGVGVPNQPGFEDGGTAAQLAGSWTLRNEASVTTGGVYQLTIDRRRMEFRKLSGEPPSPAELTRHADGRDLGLELHADRRDPLDRAEPAACARIRPWSTSGSGRSLRRPHALRRARCTSGDRRGTWVRRTQMAANAASGPGDPAPTRYVLEGTAFRQAARTGSGPSSGARSIPRISSTVSMSTGRPRLSILRADGDILLFMSDDGNLLPGDRYFSYTLNRKPPAYPQR